MAISKEIIEKVLKKAITDKKFASQLKISPAKALESVLGVDLPDDQVNAIVKAVMEKVSLESIGGMLDTDGDGKPDIGGIAKLGGAFLGKK